jgi:hypothetical protein
MEKTGFHKRFLDFPDPFRLDSDMPVTPRRRGTSGSPVHEMSFLLLTRD